MKTVSQNTPTIYSATTPENNPPQLVASLVPDEPVSYTHLTLPTKA